jgi:hypothetical protein
MLKKRIEGISLFRQALEKWWKWWKSGESGESGELKSVLAKLELHLVDL